jgi:hypothetical protein
VVDRVTIAISRETADRLRNLGRYGDTMESIIHRVLDEYEKLEKEQPRMVRSVIMALSLPFFINVMSSTSLVALITL